MSTIYLVRHCQYANPRDILPGRLPVELSEEGLEEARRLQSFFQDKKITKIFSSDVLRCKQTSETLSNQAIPIEYDPRLLEAFSAYQGFWVNDSKEFYSHQPQLGGESHKDVQNRIVDFWNSTKFEQDKNYIICSHGDPLYFLYQFLSKQPLLSETISVPPKDYQDKGSIRVVNIDARGSLKVNETLNQSTLL